MNVFGGDPKAHGSMAIRKFRAARQPVANVDAIINGGINRANSIVSAYLAGGAPVEFQRESRNEVFFHSTDLVTGMSYTGSYLINNSGIVTEYGFGIYESSYDDEGFFYAFIDLDGGASSFLAHAQTLASNSQAQVFYDAGLTGNAQPVANFLDSMPGADRYDPFSTAVSVFGNEYVFA